MPGIDESYLKMCEFVQKWNETAPLLYTEADVRLKLIDPIFTNVLDWPLREVRTEDNAGEDGFIDYNFQIEDRSRLIVEAKRDQVSFNLRPRPIRTGYKFERTSIQGS